MGEDYDVPEYDYQSLNEVKAMIKGNKYGDLGQVKEHLEFLEDMANKLNRILSSEQKRDIVDLDTGKFIIEVRKAYDGLYEIYKKMLEKLPEKHEEVRGKKQKKPILSGFKTGSISTGMVRE